jgi:hypothetical protein
MIRCQKMMSLAAGLEAEAAKKADADGKEDQGQDELGFPS